MFSSSFSATEETLEIKNEWDDNHSHRQPKERRDRQQRYEELTDAIYLGYTSALHQILFWFMSSS